MLFAIAALAFFAERQEKLAFGREFADDMESVVGGPDVIVAIDAKTVRDLERPFAPAFDILARSCRTEAAAARRDAGRKCDLWSRLLPPTPNRASPATEYQ